MAQNNNIVRSNPLHQNYKYIAVIFVVVAFLLILGVTYLALSKVTITLKAKDSQVTHSFNLTVAQEPQNSTSTNVIISGKIMSQKSKADNQFFIDSDKEAADFSEGEVVLYNDRPVAQTLVAKTRLLTAAGILFRLQNEVTIPPNGTTRAKIIADAKGSAGNIPPSSFTIPGLNTNLQRVVYAKSETGMVGGMRKIGVLQLDDVEKAEKDLKEKAIGKYITEIFQSIGDDRLVLIASKAVLNDVAKDKEIGEEIDTFTLSGNLSLTAVLADKEEILNIAKEKIKEANGAKAEFINVDPSSIKYDLIEINKEKQEAIFKIEIAGLLTLDPNKDIFDKNLLVGFTEEDLKLYFSQFESVDDVDVKFEPFWVKKVPILKDHIIIEVK
ncbi:hypothetical protein COV56_03260 [Candidatus Kuenenbacteria bacterium CG11_big_fil_rev_8_21_14_0_20_37_9]|uniref:Baseplate protein J-like barrel domain-containing protein n=2 Tax=Candidatus Kueneniibacteriota TaxID=1752740 RepID=A0A2M6XSM4_9BACT|nr:MAG: hypothetical protein AUJ29_02235 [Candidatus Kuenenbacteria bacterium CG1_02_38_13]PIR05351.1 MAG: hypothetical protein COV56_03260 [Candidatus Kuenenbacteria bacterium CG11_big_fil_rev_8_21_14_0_20_37_9]PIU10643.1 MAG: hypothetical protein COT27_02120 [Candidatus Kuenenbacteria bacterium CG08_land_8_20_14_0_20_37_23]